VALEVVALM